MWPYACSFPHHVLIGFWYIAVRVLPEYVVLFAEEEERHLRACHRFIKENKAKAFQLSIVQLMAIGGPRMGKSSLLARLQGGQSPIQDLPDTAHHPAITDGRRLVRSSGVAEVIQLKTTIKKASVDTTFACKVGEVVIWSRVSYGEEVIALLKAKGIDPPPQAAATPRFVN